MPELEEAFIYVMKGIQKDIKMFLKSITTVKRLSFWVEVDSGEENVYPGGIVFSQLENLKLNICSDNWSMILVHLLKDSPNLRILDLQVDGNNESDGEYENNESDGEYEPASWSNNQYSVPTCFLNRLETFKSKGYHCKKQERKDFLSFISKHARCLKST